MPQTPEYSRQQITSLYNTDISNTPKCPVCGHSLLKMSQCLGGWSWSLFNWLRFNLFLVFKLFCV